MYKVISILLLAVLVIVSSCNEDKKYRLKWKPEQDNPLYYHISKEIISDNVPENYKFSSDILGELFFEKPPIDEYAILSRINKKETNLVFVRYNDVLYIPDPIDEQTLHSLLNNGIISKLTFDNQGNITDGYLSKSRRNFVSVMFELPKYKVAAGDVWKLKVNLIDNQKILRIISRNDDIQVIFKRVRQNGLNQIAVLHYDLSSYLEGNIFTTGYKVERVNMLVQLKAIAEFDISNHYLINLKGVYSVKQSGTDGLDRLTRFEIQKVDYLPENVLKLARGEYVGLSEMEIQRLIAEINKKKKEQDTGRVEVFERDEQEQAPVYYEHFEPDSQKKYRVQILATKNRVPLNSELFNDVVEPITEIIEENQPYRYNYWVGETYTYDEAQTLKQKMIKKGFKDAFIVKK